MQTLIVLFSGLCIVICTKTAIRDRIYQIQDVVVDDSNIEFVGDETKHTGYARRRREHAALNHGNKSDHRRQSGYADEPYGTTAKPKVTKRPRRPVKAGRKKPISTLPHCFHNPSGYVCCNGVLNDLMIDAYNALEQRPKFHSCNIQLIATRVQMSAQSHFNTSFETIVSYDDFAQKIHFRGNMACKIEVGDRYILTYATATDAYNHDIAGHSRERRNTNEEFEWSTGTPDSWHSIHSSFI